MPRSRGSLQALAIIAAAGLAAAAVAPAAVARPGQPNGLHAAPYVENVVLVGFERGASSRARGRAVASVRATRSSSVSPIGSDTVRLTLPQGVAVEDAIKEIENGPAVRYAEPDYILTQQQVSDDPGYVDGRLWGMYGTDTNPRNPYGSRAGEAWAAGAVGSSSVYVGIVDSGVKDAHPDLAANIWTNPFDPVDGIDNDGNGYVDDVHGWDFANDDNGTFDGVSDDHGTHVAGTVGARGGNGTGVAGVNWRVTMIVTKFLSSGVGSSYDAVRALDYLTDLKLRHGLNIVVTNNSWGGPGYSQSLLDAIDRGGDAGILFIAAAGNDGSDIEAVPAIPGELPLRDTGQRSRPAAGTASSRWQA